MKSKFIFTLLLIISLIFFERCNNSEDDTATSNSTEAKWGSAIWGESKWNNCNIIKIQGELYEQYAIE